MSNLIEENVKIVVVGNIAVGAIPATFSQNISIDFIPDVVEIKMINYYDNNAAPQLFFALSSDLCRELIMCHVLKGALNTDTQHPNMQIPLKKPINGKYTFSLTNIQTGALITTAVNFNFAMTLRFVQYKK